MHIATRNTRGGVAELYVNNRHYDWTTLFAFNPDMSHREALEEAGYTDLIDMVELDENGEIVDVKPVEKSDALVFPVLSIAKTR